MIELKQGQALCQVLPEHGGRLARLQLVDRNGQPHEVFFPFVPKATAAGVWPKGGMFPLLPYSNRIANATLLHDKGLIPLHPHPEAAPHTLHGNAHLQPWTVQSAERNTMQLALESAPDTHWPWSYRAHMHIELLSDAVLQVKLSMQNTDDCSQPGGIGFHPYLNHRVGSTAVHKAVYRWLSAEGIPTGARYVLPTRHSACVPFRQTSASWTRHLGGWGGDATLSLKSGVRLHMKADAVFGHLVLHQPSPPNYLCLEPCSHVANGFNLAQQGVSDTGARLLAPGECLEGRLLLCLGPAP